MTNRPLLHPDAGQGAIHVGQGAWIVERERVLQTVLGSCVAVCLHDPAAGLGGMNHYVHPPREGAGVKRDGDSTLSAEVCMRGLLEAMLKQGAKKERLRAMAFGGGKMFEHEDSLFIGRRNSSFAWTWLANEGIPLDLCDFHGNYARKLIFCPASGRHLCQRMATIFANSFSSK